MPRAESVRYREMTESSIKPAMASEKMLASSTAPAAASLANLISSAIWG
jgi:hypothetical protein